MLLNDGDYFHRSNDSRVADIFYFIKILYCVSYLMIGKRP